LSASRTPPPPRNFARSIGRFSRRVSDARAQRDLPSGTQSRISRHDINSAELIKHASNSFLALKISYANVIADLCEKIGANVEEVTHAMGLDARIGGQFLKAGLGYGGFCSRRTCRLHSLVGFRRSGL